MLKYQFSFFFQGYFSVTINGREVHSIENTNPKTFTNVIVLAGDNSKPAADASYRNLSWENFHVDHSFDVGTKIQRDREIGIIDSWGPLFRISLDLIIHSRVNNGFSSVLAFRGNGVTNDCCFIGDRIPAILLYNPTMTLQFANSVRHYGNYWFEFKINRKTWYNIIIEQKFVHRKVKRKYQSIFIPFLTNRHVMFM